MRVLIEKSSNLIAVSDEDGQALPPRIRRSLEEMLSYKLSTFVHGYQSWDFDTRERHPVTTETRYLYEYDDDGRFMCGAGYIYRFLEFFKMEGLAARVVDTDRGHPNPKRYHMDW